MGLIDKLGDKAVEKFAKKETIRLSFEQVAEIVNREFIIGADDEFLSQVIKTAKGGAVKAWTLVSKNGRYEMRVAGDIPNILDLLLGRKKVVWVEDNEANKFYQLDKDRKWKKFYKAVETACKMERINRSR